MAQKLFKLIYEDREVNGREFTKVKMLVLVENLTDEIIKEVTGATATPGFKLNFRFNEKPHVIAYPVRSNNGEKVYKPMNNYRSNDPNEERPMIEFSGDCIRNVFKGDPNYDDKIHLKDCFCTYESTLLLFDMPVEKLVEI